MKAARTARLMLALLCANMAVTTTAWAETKCHRINAKGEGQIDFATNTSHGVLIGGGLLHGDTRGEFTLIADGYIGTFTITTKHGTLILSEFDGRFNLETGAFSNNSTVISGTGRLENATGTLFFEGFVSGGDYADHIRGEICLASDADDDAALP